MTTPTILAPASRIAMTSARFTTCKDRVERRVAAMGNEGTLSKSFDPLLGYFSSGDAVRASVPFDGDVTVGKRPFGAALQGRGACRLCLSLTL
jgi:hypothetical protein